MGLDFPLALNPTDAYRQTSRVSIAIWLVILLMISGFLSVYKITENPYVLDEMWTVEITMGRGTVHQHLPLNEVIAPPPPFYSLKDAAPWWDLWTHMEITHPPLYAICLRWWEDLFGDSDASGRLFSGVATLCAVAVLFDLVRMQAGLERAFWAGLLMAVACPQVEYSRITRGYTLLTTVALLTANVLVRIQLFGLTRRRIALLALALCATAFNHYFACGTLLALLGFAVWKMPTHRRVILWVYVLIGLIFAAAWGPFMWQQRHLFATDDPATLFLRSEMPHHFRVTAFRLLVSPVILMFPLNRLPVPVAAIIGGIVYLLPLIPALFRRNQFVLMWGLWLAGTMAVVSGMDFFRKTDHLYFIRYIILAGPAVYALIPLLFSLLNRWSCRLAVVAVVCICAFNLPGIYARNPADPRQIVRNFVTAPTAADLLIVASSPNDVPNAQVEVLRLARYIDPMTCPIAMLTGHASPDVLGVAQRSRFVFLLARGEGDATDYRNFLPNAHIIDVKTYPGLGRFWTLQPDHLPHFPSPGV